MIKQVNLNRTQAQFVLSRKLVSTLIGPAGEGKSWAAIIAICYHASQHKGQKIRVAIIRDSFRNLERNTIPSIQRLLGQAAYFKAGGMKMVSQTTDWELEADLFGINDLNDLSNLQGSEYHLTWIEEPAPIYESGNSGLTEEVFDIAIARGPREIGSQHRVLVTMNPASEGHWTHRRFIEEPNPEIMDIFRVPYGENPYLPEGERERTKEAFKNRPELYARFVLGQFSFISLGESVVPEYDESFHRSRVILDPISDTMTYRFWDGGLYPSCVIGQITPTGRFFVLDTLRGENMGMKQFLTTQVKPLLARRYPPTLNLRWRDLGDPAINTREQSDSTQTASLIINSELGANFESGEGSWEARREALKEVLSRNIGGQSLFQLSKHETILHCAFKGGWHYRKTKTGEVIKDIPVKDIHSHPSDALTHGLAKIFEYKPTMPKISVGTYKKRASSYAPQTLQSKTRRMITPGW